MTRYWWTRGWTRGSASPGIWDRHAVDRTVWFDKADAIISVIAGPSIPAG